MEFRHIIILCGHYGSGKTTVSLNLALHFSKLGKTVTLVDLDVVNPYFRSSDYTVLLERQGIRMVAPGLAGTTLDIPALTPEISGAIESDRDFIIIDAGGDDAGATALGRFSAEIQTREYEMLYVVNQNRPMVARPADAAGILREIENASHLAATGLVNNTHLAEDTTPQIVADSGAYAREVSELTGLPLKFTSAGRAVADSLSSLTDILPMELLVRPPWPA